MAKGHVGKTRTVNPDQKAGIRKDLNLLCRGQIIRIHYFKSHFAAKGFHVSIDSDFGPATDTVVRQFQAACNLDDDGIVGSGTWAYLSVTDMR